MKRWKYERAGDFGLSPLESARSHRREPGIPSIIAHDFAWSCLSAFLSRWLRLRIEGRENLPHDGPMVLVANHSSHLDAMLLGLAVPPRLRRRLLLLAAGDTFFTTRAKSFASALFLGAIPVWRRKSSPRALIELRKRLLAHNDIFVLFPEGTRARDGQLATFKDGIGILVSGTSIPVVPCWIDGAFDAWPPDRKFPRRGRVCIRIGRPLQFALASEDRAGWSRTSRILQWAVARQRSRPARQSL